MNFTNQLKAVNSKTDIIITASSLESGLKVLLHVADKYIWSRMEEYTLFVPDHLWDELNKNDKAWTAFMIEARKNNNFKYHGIKVVNGYENKIILAHRDHIMFPREGSYYQVFIK